MDPKGKWRDYVQKLGHSEVMIKNYIKEFRTYKKKLQAQKHENPRSPELKKLFAQNPNFHLDRIENERIKIKFCEAKIKYYKELTINGENLNNQTMLFELNQECQKLMKTHSDILNWTRKIGNE